MPETETKVDADIEELLSTIEKKEIPYKLIIFNDDHHSMDEVVVQLIKALKCPVKTAIALMKEAHMTGQAVAKVGSLKECQEAQRILEEIDLATDIIAA